MNQNLIVDTPSIITCVVLQNWVDLKSLVALDSAFCDKILRKEFMLLIQSKGFILQEHVIVANDQNVCWLRERRIRVRCVWTTGLSGISLRTYLSFSGSKVRTVIPVLGHQTKNVVLDSIMTHCRDLTFLCVGYCIENEQLRRLVQ